MNFQSRRIFSFKIDFAVPGKNNNNKMHQRGTFKEFYGMLLYKQSVLCKNVPFFAYDRLWDHSRSTALSQHAGNNYNFQVGSILTCRNKYLFVNVVCWCDSYKTGFRSLPNANLQYIMLNAIKVHLHDSKEQTCKGKQVCSQLKSVQLRWVEVAQYLSEIYDGFLF